MTDIRLESGDPETRTLEDVAAERVRAADLAELTIMVRFAVARAWPRRAWTDEDETGCATVARELLEAGVRVR